MKNLPRVTFGIIVLNGEPFIPYCLRSIYSYAYEIIVVEGACKSAAAIATSDGHSTDGTLESLKRFIEEEDPERKVKIIARNGFWSEKDEQSQAYAKEATGDYLWQIDIDEFYHSKDMLTVLKMIRDDPQITSISFKQIQFWGDFSYLVDSWHNRRGGGQFHRLFRWGEGFVYQTHRPPTVLTKKNQDTRKLKWLNANDMKKQGVFLYHYSFVFPKQVFEKCKYYSSVSWVNRKEAVKWAQEIFMELRNPYRVHIVYDYPGWLQRFKGEHPEQIELLKADLASGRIKIKLRSIEDIERLIRSPTYKLKCVLLKFWELLDRKIKLL